VTSLKPSLGTLESIIFDCTSNILFQIKYLLATRCDLASKLLNFLYPSIFLGLQDAVDDVVGVAASALVPVVSNLIFSPSIDVAPLTARLWDALRTLDDLTSSTHSVMHLLSELLRLQSDEYPEKLETPDASLAELVSRLFPFLSHSSTLVRKAALNTLDTVTSRLDLAEIFLPAVIQALSSHLFQRALLEHHEPNLFLIERIWNNVCDFTPLGPLLMSTCPLYGTWVTLITQPPNWPLPPSLLLVRQGEDREPEAQYLGGPEAAHIVDPVEKDKFQTRARWLGAKMLGKLAGFIVQPVPGMDYSKDVMPPMEMFVTKILLPHLQTYSAHRRAAMALVVTEWCNQHETSEVPDSLKLLLYTFLIESPNYDETIQALNVLRTETTDFVSTLKHYKLQIPAVLIKSSPQDLGLEDLRSGLADQNYDQLFAHTKVKKSILRGLIERKEGLAQSITSIISEHNLLSVMTLATTAGAVIGIGALTDKLNPVIKPLMESLKMERNEQLQSQAALMLAKILDICITRGMMAPVDKVVKNLVNFVSSDAISLPQFVDDPTAAENSVILTLKIREMQSAKKPKKSGASASKASESSAETGKSSSDNGPQTAADAAVRNEKSRGARIALETIVRHFHDQVFVRIPKLHDLTLGAVTAWNTAVGTQLIADFGFCLRAFEVVIPVVSSSLYPSLAAALTNLVLLLCNEHSNVRHLAARCIGELSKIQPVAVMTCVINSVIPLLASDRFKHRQGVIECLACIVDKMEMDIIPYIVLLIVPVLGRMSDHNESVRLLATNTFATLIR
jgi:TATA-binding protein-associated factor